MNDYGDMMKGFDQFNAEAGAYSGDGSAIRIEAACMQGGGSVEMEIHPYDTKESVCDVMVKALGLEALQKSGRFRPFFTNVRDETCPVDNSPMGDFVRNGEKLRLNAFAEVA